MVFLRLKCSLSFVVMYLLPFTSAGTYTILGQGWVPTSSTVNGGYQGAGCSYGIIRNSQVTNGTLQLYSSFVGTYRWNYSFSPAGSEKPLASDRICRVSGYSWLHTFVNSQYGGNFTSSLQVTHAGVPTTSGIDSFSWSNTFAPPPTFHPPVGSTTPAFIGNYPAGFTATQQSDGTWTGYFEWTGNVIMATNLVSAPRIPTYAPAFAEANVFYSVQLVLP